MSQDSQSLELRLTYAELEAINGDDPQWPRARKALGFDEPKDKDLVRGCGLSSLLAREFVVTHDKELMMMGTLADAAKRLLDATHWVELTVLRDEDVSPAVYGVADDGTSRILAAVVALGVLGLQPLSDDLTPAEQLEAITRAALDSGDLTVVIRPQDAGALLIKHQSDQWLLGTSDDPAGPYAPSTQDDAMARIHDLLAANLPG